MMSINAMAYGIVAVGAVVLALGGGPGSRAAKVDAEIAAANAVPVPAYSANLARQMTAQAAMTGPQAPAATAAAAGITLRSVGFELPTQGRAFPAGPGADLMASNCMSCHTPGMILTQPKLTQAEWTGEVNKMINVYKAPVDKSDVPAIVTYLASLKP